MIWIRADANREIGTGHVMRCLSVARALAQCGEQVCFLLADESAAPLLEAAGQDYRILHTDYARMEEELPQLTELLSKENGGFFLADSYFVTPEYLRNIREYVPVGCMDDRCLSDLPADLLINYNIFACEALYGDRDCRAAQRLLLGTRYAPLRQEFAGVEYRVRERAEQVLITTGGSDPYHLAGKLLREALSRPETASLRYLVVSGAYNAHLQALREMEAKCANVKVAVNVSDMCRLMRESDIAVSAGGSTMYELSAVGVPIVCFSFVENQEPIVKEFVERGLVCFGGDYLRQGDGLFAPAVDGIAGLAADRELRQSYSHRQRHIVDGGGALRIAREIQTTLA